jgi:hypothetical protein
MQSACKKSTHSFNKWILTDRMYIDNIGEINNKKLLAD